MSNWEKWRKIIGLDAFDYAVPAHANSFFYSLGGITLFCFSITIITGILLTQFYNPTPQIAHASVRYISETAGLGWLRALHHWSADVGFMLLIAHMLRVMFTGAFRAPRIPTYLAGLVLMFVVFQIYFTGTVLKWDQEGYEAMEHFVALNSLLGPLGAVFQEDFTLSTSMLSRIYGLHVGVLPILFLSVAGLHMLYVKHFGVAPKPFQSAEDYESNLARGATFSRHVIGLLGYGIALLIVLIGLALFFQPSLLEAPKPGIEVTKPPWLFWIFYPLESAMGISGILVGSLILGAGLLLIPILGIMVKNEKKLFTATRILVIVGLIGWVALMITTFFSPVMKHI